MVLLAVLPIVLISCTDKEKNADDDTKIEYPIEIPFTDYVLGETSCQWNFNDDTSKIVIINSEAELEEYVRCTGNATYPQVDFSKHTLLLAHGQEPYLVKPDFKNVRQFSEQHYEMTVNLRPATAAVVTPWQVPILVDKLTDDAIVKLIVTKNYTYDLTCYVIGYNVQTVDTVGKAGQYLLVSENLKDTFAVCNMPDNLFTFPADIVKPANICGFNLFPEKYRHSYKAKMSYRPMTTEEEYHHSGYSCNALWLTLYTIRPQYIFITSISKNY